MTRYIIRRCEGRKTCWAAELADGYLCGTDYDLGRLVETVFDRAQGDCTIHLQLSPDTETAARNEARSARRQRLEREIANHQSEIKLAKKYLAESAPC